MEGGPWEVNLGGDWKPLGEQEVALIGFLVETGQRKGKVECRGTLYEFDVQDKTQTNVVTGKVRQIRPAAGSSSTPRFPVFEDETSSRAAPSPSSPDPKDMPLSAAVSVASISSSAFVKSFSKDGGTGRRWSLSSRSSKELRDLRDLKACLPACLPVAAKTACGSSACGGGDGDSPPSEPEVEELPCSTSALTPVEVWLAGEWKKLGMEEVVMINRKRDCGQKIFDITSRTFAYRIDLNQMTQTNLRTGRTRTIRFSEKAAMRGQFGFEQFRVGFRTYAPTGKLLCEELVKSWPSSPGISAALVEATATSVVKEMDLRRNGAVDMMEWNHFWAMERDSPSFHAGNEVNVKIQKALKKDPQVLGRMQMHFETAVGEESGMSGLLSGDGLIRACQRLVASPQHTLEKQWAKEVLAKHESGEGLDKGSELSYYDFLNVMLGRKRYKVSLWLYDISDGTAARWSWLLLGQHLRGIWHTGIVVEWAERSSEFWFGGSLFESLPGSTPFGEPLEKRPLGHTYKLREEVWHHVQRHLAPEFTRDNYDVLTHNCNHFTEKLSMYLRGEHIPDEVLKQPEMVMSKTLPQLMRPVLNRWLGGFASEEGRATDGGKEMQRIWKAVQPGALVEFSKEEGGRPLVGEVTGVTDEDCSVVYLNFWNQKAEERLGVPSAQISKVLRQADSDSVPGVVEVRVESSSWMPRVC